MSTSRGALFRRESAQGDAAVAAFVKRHLGERHWEETLLLMMGSEATRMSLIDAVCMMLCEVDTWKAWLFGVGLLREEVDLSPAWRTRVLDGAAATAQHQLKLDARFATKRLSDVLRFSRRHGQSVALWRDDALRSWPAERLPIVVILCSPKPPGLVAHRNDRDAVVMALLDLDFDEPYRMWARQVAGREILLAWSMQASVALSFWLGLEAFAPEAEAFVAVTVLSLARRWSWLGHASAAVARASSKGTFTKNYTGVPNSILIQTTQNHLIRTQCTPCAMSTQSVKIRPPYTKYLDTQNDFFPQPNQPIISSTLVYPAIFLASVESFRKARNIIPKSAAGDKFYVFDNIQKADLPLTAKQIEKIRFRTTAYTTKTFPTPPSTQSTNGHQSDETHHIEAPLVVHLTAEAYVGILHGREGALPLEESAYLATARMQNRWLYLFIDHLARQAPRSSEHQALLIALGLAQYQTTGMWPWGTWWHQTFAGEAPAHWLPAAMWHMCFAVGEPENPAHEAAVDAAFARGADPNNPEAWPELAEALRQHRLHATPPEVLALYDHGDATGDEASGDA